MKETTLRFGAGRGAIRLPQPYFESFDEKGNLIREDGFTGAVHVFPGEKGPIQDDPTIRVLLLESGEMAALVSMEIAQAPEDQIRYTREIVGEICGVKKENIWVHSTHQFGFMHRPHDAKKAEMYDEAMKSALKDAATEAAASLQPALLGIGTGECHVSANKNILPPPGVEGGPYYGPGSTLETNPTMTVLRFEAPESGKLLGLYFSYGTKPSTLLTTGKNDGNRELNSEVTGQACKRLEQHFGVPCLSCMPAAGDQYPRETAMFYGFDEDGNWRIIDLGFPKGIKIVDRLSAEMAEDALKIAEGIVCKPWDAPLRVAATGFRYPNKSGDGELTIPVEALTLGDLAFVGLRQETDCLTERQVMEASPYGTTLLITFLNGDGKYMAHWEAYDFNGGIGTWESARSAFQRGAAEKFVSVATELLKTLKAGGEVLPLEEAPSTAVTGAYRDRIAFGGRSWLVLDQKGKRRLLLSEKLVDVRPYHDKNEPVTWADCALRAWLNGEFLDTFREKDRERIPETAVRNPPNPKYAIRGGGETRDRVFLLSLEEAELYLGGFGDLLVARNEEDHPRWWHLRSPGEAEDVAASVSAGGMIDYHGVSEAIDRALGGVRPALWLKE